MKIKLYLCLILALFISACSLTQPSIKHPSTPVTTTTPPPSSAQQPVLSNDKLAIIIPEKSIKSYSSIVINASLAYILRKDAKMNTEIFLIGSEDEQSIRAALEKIKAKGVKFIIAAFTTRGVNFLNDYEDFIFYIPTLHKNNTQIKASNVYFGGIDYKAQVEKLSQQGSAKIASFYDDSTLSSYLNSILSNYSARTYFVGGKKLNYISLLYSKGSLSGASIFLNTPLTKSAIIASQLRVNNITPSAILATQIAYNPILLSLTQPGDRKKMLIANSISNTDEYLSYLNESFEQSIDYNWVAYSTSIGVDFIYTSFIDKGAERLFKEPMKDNQILYDIKLMKALEFGFEEANGL